MSDSDGEEVREFGGFYGKALEPYEEDEVPKKRPISIEDQVAKDAQGRRRFHGAFTGGFSAGFFNTVGSLEGWRPSEFKSSRSEKAQSRVQQPQDYMDDEDMGEFGIAPQKVKATEDYNTSKKRKKQSFADGPIPGEPVLQTLIESGNETIGYLLLRNMGYKHAEDEEINEDEVDEPEETRKIYGCEMPKTAHLKKSFSSITCSIHEIYKNALANPKANSFGMSYSGLDRSHINLFRSSKLVVNEANSKKLSISGQAFGVGAFEDDDDDIYAKEDISKYDFELTAERQKEKSKDNRKLVFDMFVKCRSELPTIEKFLPPSIPSSYTGKHKVKKSRFEPVQTPEETPQRHEIDAATRGAILGETTNTERRPQSLLQQQKPPDVPKEDKPTIKTEDASTPRRSLFDLGPNGLVFDKFVSAGKSEEHSEILQPVERSESLHGTKEMRDAAKMKMFGPLTRITESWIPNSLVCKRFNVPESVFSDVDVKAKSKSSRNLIFESASAVPETPLNTPSSSRINLEAGGLQKLVEVAASSLARPRATDTAEATASAASNSGANLANVSITSSSSTTLSAGQPNVEQSAHVEEKKALDPSERLDLSKSVDLFKAVFADSDSDDEDADDVAKDATGDGDGVDEERRLKDEMKAKVLSEDLLVPHIKPIKHGILSNVESLSFNKLPEEKVEPVGNDEEESAMDVEITDNGAKSTNSITSDNIYGPMLPTAITFRRPEKADNAQNKPESDSNSDMDWVEKGDEKKSTKSHKHKKQKKKHKKEKHKDKKHKDKRR